MPRRDKKTSRSIQFTLCLLFVGQQGGGGGRVPPYEQVLETSFSHREGHGPLSLWPRSHFSFLGLSQSVASGAHTEGAGSAP